MHAEAWYADRTVVVTGAFGYLGSGLCARLRAAGARLRCATRGREGLRGDEVLSGELTDPDFARRLVEGADAVFHMAAQTSIKVSHDDPVSDLRANVESTVVLLDACRRGGRRPAFVYAGTATEIGLTTVTPIRPNAPDLPITVYDANKLAAEQLVGVYTDHHEVRGVTLRIANVYGPGAAKSAPDRGVTNKLVGWALAGRDLTYFGDGTLRRDYVYVDDLLDAFFRAPAVPGPATARSFVVGAGVGVSLRESFEMIADVVADLGYKRVNVSSAPWPAGSHPIDKRSFVSDVSPLSLWSGWEPRVSLREGLRLTALSLLEGSAGA